MSGEDCNLLVVLGPTATGKTRLAVGLARSLAGEIISADSRQVYRRLDIGTGKDLAEYGRGPDRVPVHLIDLIEPEAEYSVYAFQQDCHREIEAVWARGRLPILAGGTGLYLSAVLEGYEMVTAPEDPALRAELAGLSDEALEAHLRAVKPDLHNLTDLTTRERTIRAIEIALRSDRAAPPAAPALHPLVLGTRFDRGVLDERIAERLRARLDTGLIEEVEALLAEGLTFERLDALGLEYRFVADYLRDRIADKDELCSVLSKAIRKFARRQLSWFRRMERKGIRIHWLDGADLQQALATVRRLAPDLFPAPDSPAGA